MTMFTISGLDVVLARDLTPADDGAHSYTVTATENGVSVSVTGTLNVTTVVHLAVPTAVSLGADPSTLHDSAKAGDVVSPVSVSMSDSSVFSGVLDVTGPA